MTELTNDHFRKTLDQLSFNTQAIIGGKAVSALSEKTFSTENPATGKPLADITACQSEDVDRAVRAARQVFEKGDWSRRAPAERRRVLHRFADLIEKNTLELALLEALEAGKPISECVNTDIHETAECIRWHAEATDKLYD